MYSTNPAFLLLFVNECVCCFLVTVMSVHLKYCLAKHCDKDLY